MAVSQFSIWNRYKDKNQKAKIDVSRVDRKRHKITRIISNYFHSSFGDFDRTENAI